VIKRARAKEFIGTRLLQAAYHYRACGLYAKLGFDVQEAIVTLKGRPSTSKVPGFSVRGAREDDLEEGNRVADAGIAEFIVMWPPPDRLTLLESAATTMALQEIMSPVESDRFLAIMSKWFRYATDEIYGPIYGPGGPHMRFDRRAAPDPQPWREVVSADEAVKFAEAVELATPGMGVAFLLRFADDPDNWCGTRVPGRPRPKGDEQLDRVALGAALHFVAEGVGNQDLAGTVKEIGQDLIGR
jgi:hypothetical protein